MQLVIGISESNLSHSVFTSEIQINEYELLRCGGKRFECSVASHTRNNPSYNIESYFSKDKEIIF